MKRMRDAHAALPDDRRRHPIRARLAFAVFQKHRSSCLGLRLKYPSVLLKNCKRQPTSADLLRRVEFTHCEW